MKKRPIRSIEASSRFKKSLRHLPPAIQNKLDARDQWFRQNAFDPRLKTHQLKGKREGFWSYSVDYRYRVVFKFARNDVVVYVDVGTHDVYR